MTSQFAAIGTTLFTIALLYFGALCYFGVRRDRAPWSFLAFVAAAVLAYWGQQFLDDSVRLWSGKERLRGGVGLEALVCMAFVAVRHQGWLIAQEAHGRIRQMPKGRPHAR